MMLFKIAFRNILRNGRRSLMTASAIAVGAIALIMFGEYVGYMVRGFETGIVANSGHVSVFHKGYIDNGTGNPAGYSISGYRKVMALIENDPELKPMITVVTPTVTLFGIAGNFDIDTSKTFLGTGVVPSDLDKMRHWNDYGIFGSPSRFPIRDGDDAHGIVGVGLARMLGLCKPLKVPNCPSPPQTDEPAKIVAAGPAGLDLAELASRDRDPSRLAPADNGARIDLLAATATGAPNVVGITIIKARSQGAKEYDDMYVGMTIGLAQQLLYGRGEHKAVSIMIQLQHTADIPKAMVRLNALFKEHKLDLEVRDFRELQPQYNLVIGFFGAIFLFISVIMGVIVLFTVVNTMSMSVMERTNEIGTARAMGVRRSGIRRQFLVEGWMLGLIGATAGVALSAVIAAWFNTVGATWTPPGEASPIPLKLLTSGVLGFQFVIWLALVLIAIVAALIPSNRAARMPVVDALRHV